MNPAFSQNAGEAGHPARPMGPALARMQAAMNSFRSYLEKGSRGKGYRPVTLDEFQETVSF